MARIGSLPMGERIVSALPPSSGEYSSILARLSGVINAFTTAATYVLLLLFGAVFIAADPTLHRKGLLSLIPQRHRDLGSDALAQTGTALRQWMLGQFVSMTVIGLLTGAGLWLMGVPSALALGLIAGVAEIIPWTGPILSAVPILIVALADGPETALLALALVVAVQQIEGSLIMPYVQKKAVSLPPALTVFGVVAGGLLFGPVGLIFAGPLLVVRFVLTKRLYVEEVLQTPTQLPDDG